MLTALRDKFKAEQEKMRGMTWRQKLGYLKDYYTASVVILLIAVLVIVAFAQGWQNKGNESYLNCAVLEYTGVYSALEQAGEGYLAGQSRPGEGNLTGRSEREETSVREEAAVFDKEDTAGAHIIVFDDSDITTRGLETGRDFQKFQGLSAQLSVGDVDIIFLTEEMLLFLQVKRDGYFVPLTEVYTSEELERLGEVVFAIPDENDEEYPVAIDVSGWEALEGHVTRGIPLYAAIVAGGAHREHAAGFLLEMSEGWNLD